MRSNTPLRSTEVDEPGVVVIPSNIPVAASLGHNTLTAFCRLQLARAHNIREQEHIEAQQKNRAAAIQRTLQEVVLPAKSREFLRMLGVEEAS